MKSDKKAIEITYMVLANKKHFRYVEMWMATCYKPKIASMEHGSQTILMEVAQTIPS